MRAFWSLNEDILKITILKTNTPYPSRKIRRIRACTHQRPQNIKDQYAVSRGLNMPYSRYGINIIFWKISKVVPTPRNPQYALNTAYLIPLNTAYPVLCPIQHIHLNRLIRLRMTKVIKGEFEEIKDVKVEDVSLTYDTSLEIFNMEVSRLSGMDNDLFTYKVKVANILCNSVMDDDLEDETDDDMGYDPSDIRGDDEVELTDEESSDDEDEIAEVFRIDTNIFDYETPICSAFNEFNYLLKTDTGVWTEPKPVKHTCEPFNYKTGYSEWPMCSWKEDGYCNGKNLPGTYIIENQLHYQDYECHLRSQRKWNIYTNYDDAYEINHEDNGNKELCEIHEPPVCNIRKYMMIKYSFNDDEEYVAVKEDEYDDLIMTRRDVCQAYLEIFWIMDEGWMVTRAT
ncbi:hypothetical protein Tco_1009297 [Tanacetum coccineum]